MLKNKNLSHRDKNLCVHHFNHTLLRVAIRLFVRADQILYVNYVLQYVNGHADELAFSVGNHAFSCNTESPRTGDCKNVQFVSH